MERHILSMPGKQAETRCPTLLNPGVKGNWFRSRQVRTDAQRDTAVRTYYWNQASPEQ